MKEYELFIDLPENPKGTAQQKGVQVRNGKPHFYTKPEIINQAAIYKALLLREAKKNGISLNSPDGEIKIKITFYFETKDKKKQGTPKTSPGDLDNLLKLLFDVMTSAGFWKDDSRITELHAEKRWAASAGIYIKLHREEKGGAT